MAMKPLVKPGSTRIYVSPRDPDYKADGNHGPNATRFELRSLSGQQMAYVQDHSAQSEVMIVEGKPVHEVKMTMYQAAYASISVGVVGWVNFGPDFKQVDGYFAGEPVKVMDNDLLKLFDPSLALELHRAITDSNSVDWELAGNSAAS